LKRILFNLIKKNREVIFFKYLKKITSRFFFIKLNKILFNAKLKQKTFLTKLIYLKSLNLKILNKLVLKLSLKLINIL